MGGRPIHWRQSHVQPRLGRHPRPRPGKPVLRRHARRARLPPHLLESFGCAWGVEWPEFWAQLPDGGEAIAGNGTHVAFIAPSREAVDRFHAAALAAGGSDAGAPGPRDYTPDYYAAFVRDPDGNKLEAVHLPEVPFPEK